MSDTNNTASSTATMNQKPFIIAVAGGTASGKTTVCMEIIKRLGVPSVTVLAMDRFYRSLLADDSAHLHNFDVPEAFDFDMFHQSIQQLVTSRSVPVPRYSYRTHQRLAEVDVIDHADVVIVEGILTLYHPEVRKLFDMKIYVDTDDDVRLARRIKRDMAERGRSVDDVLHQYLYTVKPAFDEFIAPTKRYADIIIPRGGENLVAIDLLVQHIKRQLRKRGVQVSAQPLPLQPQAYHLSSPPQQPSSKTAAVAVKGRLDQNGTEGDEKRDARR